MLMAYMMSQGISSQRVHPAHIMTWGRLYETVSAGMYGKKT
jgi:hypothetical protein